MGRISDAIVELTAPKANMLHIVEDQDDGFDKKIQNSNLFKPLSGSGAPGTTPEFVGQRYFDTAGNRVYEAFGTSTSADWHKTARYEYGVETIVDGGGDVTVNLDFEWEDGSITVFLTETASEYMDGTDDKNVKFETTYDALTNGSYSTFHLYKILNRSSTTTNNQDNLAVGSKGAAGIIGKPISATSKSVTFLDSNDGSPDVHIKYLIIA